VPFRELIRLLCTIPSVSVLAAIVILAEIGRDMSRFPTPGHLVIADSGVAAGNCGAQVHFHLVRAQGHPQQMRLDELSIGLRDRVRAVSLQVAAEDIDYQRLQLWAWHPSNRSRWGLPAKRCLRDVVQVAHAVLVGVGRGHAVALHVKQAPGQERRRASDAAAPLGRLRGELCLHISEQHDRHRHGAVEPAVDRSPVHAEQVPSAQLVAVGVIFYVLPWIGLELQDTARAVATGIEPERIGRIFDASDGMGLGLAICRSIVEAHGGTLSASAGDPHGSVFWIAFAK
jgi:hypothetical protein